MISVGFGDSWPSKNLTCSFAQIFLGTERTSGASNNIMIHLPSFTENIDTKSSFQQSERPKKHAQARVNMDVRFSKNILIILVDFFATTSVDIK